MAKPKTLRMVVGFLFDDRRDHVLLIQKDRPEWQAGRLNGIGGKIEPKETAIEAMIREFHEETGLLVTNWLPFLELADVRGLWTVQFFKAFGSLRGARRRESEIPVIVQVDKLPGYVIPNLRWLIPMALDPSNVEGQLIDNTAI